MILSIYSSDDKPPYGLRSFAVISNSVGEAVKIAEERLGINHQWMPQRLSFDEEWLKNDPIVILIESTTSAWIEGME